MANIRMLIITIPFLSGIAQSTLPTVLSPTSQSATSSPGIAASVQDCQSKTMAGVKPGSYHPGAPASARGGMTNLLQSVLVRL
jgi:hypothetical protein